MSIVSFFIFIIIGAAGGAEAGESIATAHEHTAKEHVVIRIGDLGIQPESQTLAAQEAVVWINYGQVPVRITLEPGAATRVSCREPSHFEVEESGELRAPMLEAFGMASLCLLSPGEYGYTVEELDLVSRPIRVLPGGRRFSGALVVREEPSGSPRSSSISNLAFYHRTLAMTEHELARFYDELASMYEDMKDFESAGRERGRAHEARVTAAEHDKLAQSLEQVRGSAKLPISP